MQNFNNGNLRTPGVGGCDTPAYVPGVVTIPFQPDVCPAPPAVRIPTESQTRQYERPDRACNVELGDIAGNTVVASFLVIGGDQCFDDDEIRDAFDLDAETPIIRATELNCLLNSQTAEGTFTFTAGGVSDAAEDALFRQNAQQFFRTLTDFNDPCPFVIKRDFRCNPCADGGEKIQSFGGSGCAPLVVGPNRLFGMTLPIGAILEDATLCLCAYSLPGMVSCATVDSCPPPPPAPPICPPTYVQPALAPAFTNGRGY